MIEKLGPGLANSGSRDAMHLYSLALLKRIPKNDALRTKLDQALIGKIIPARDRQDRRDSEGARRLDIIGLVVAELDDRGHQKQVRGPLSKGFDKSWIGNNDPIHKPGKVCERLPNWPAFQPGKMLKSPEDARRQAAGATCDKGWRVVIGGFEIAQEIAHRPRRIADRPPPASARSNPLFPNVWVLAHECAEQRLVNRFLPRREDDPNFVAARGKLAQGILEIAQIERMPK